MLREPALLTSGDRMSKRSQHRVSEGQDVRSERPATGHGQPRATRRMLDPCQFHRFHGVLSDRLWKQETVSRANMIPR
jgi:hypothetical protein